MKQRWSVHFIISVAFMVGTLPLQAQRMQRLSATGIGAIGASGYDFVVPSAVPAPREAARKIPVVAWAISFAVPGGGQVYNGQWGKAIPMFIMYAAGAGAFLSQQNKCRGNYENGYYLENPRCDDSDAVIGSVGVVLVLASWIWSQIDAPIAAGRINRHNATTVEVAPSVVPLRPAALPSMAGYSLGSERTDRATVGLKLATITF